MWQFHFRENRLVGSVREYAPVILLPAGRAPVWAWDSERDLGMKMPTGGRDTKAAGASDSQLRLDDTPAMSLRDLKARCEAM
jgi:hypothetical protein